MNSDRWPVDRWHGRPDGGDSPDNPLRRGSLPEPAGGFEQTVVILAARGACAQMYRSAGICRPGVLACEFKLDVGVENVGACVASGVSVFGPQQIL
jgi:hypothetical protein